MSIISGSLINFFQALSHTKAGFEYSSQTDRASLAPMCLNFTDKELII